RRRGYGGADGELLRREPGQLVVAELSGGQVDLRLASPLETAHANVADDADDRPLLECEEEMLTDRVLAGPHIPSERLAHEGDVGRGERVRVGDEPAGAEGDAERREEAGSRETQAGRPRRFRLRRLAREPDWPDAAAHGHGQKADVTGGGDTRQR